VRIKNDVCFGKTVGLSATQVCTTLYSLWHFKLLFLIDYHHLERSITSNDRY